MKLHLDRLEGRNAFTGYGQGYVAINGRPHSASLIVLPDRLIDPWNVARPEALEADHLEILAALHLEIVLIGTGERHHMLHPRLTHPLMAARIGVEVMTTPAACRTYNILLAEGRKVAAALIVP